MTTVFDKSPTIWLFIYSLLLTTRRAKKAIKMPGEDEYDVVALNDGDGGRDRDAPEGENIIKTKLKRLGWLVFPWVSLLMYLGDVVTSFCYAAVLFKYADDRYVKLKGLNFCWWGSLIILVHILSGIFINLIAAFDR